MEYEWDPAKAASNATKHGVSFETVRDFDWDQALVIRDPRYAEERYRAIGFIGDRLHVCVYTMRGTAVRIISLWKANNRAIRRYMEFLDAQENPDEHP